MLVNRILLSVGLGLSLTALTGCGTIVDDLDDVGNRGLVEGTYNGYYDYYIFESEETTTLSFYSITNMPYWDNELDVFMDASLLEVQTMFEDYYKGDSEGVVYVEQLYPNGHCSTRCNLESGAFNIVCKLDGF